MPTARFDLNDIDHEPSDEQLRSLMDAVSEEARRKARETRQQLIESLRTALRQTIISPQRTS